MRRILAFLAIAVCAASADAGWWDDAGAARRTTLEELRQDPGLWRDVTVALDVRFAAVVEPGDACSTRFDARDWRAVAAFAAETTPGSPAAKKPFTSIFVRRGSVGESRLADVAKGAKVQLRAAVRDSVRGEPWIEVFDATADGDPLTPEEAGVVARADEFLAHDNAAAAEPLYRGLVAKRALPASVRADLWRKIGAASWTRRRIADAADAYAASLAADPKDAATARQLAAAKTALESTSAAEVAAVVSAPARRLLPPTGMDERPAEATPPVAAPRDVDTSPPTPTTPAPPADDPAPPSPPKPRLAGPK